MSIKYQHISQLPDLAAVQDGDLLAVSHNGEAYAADASLFRGPPAKINGSETITIRPGTHMTLDQSGNVLTLDALQPTNVSDLVNDANFQTAAQVETAINRKVSGAYKAGGSAVSVAALPALLADNLGVVVNMSAAFTTTADFIEGAGKTFPAGTNVVVALINGAYKYDVLAGFVDLSGKVDKTTTINGHALSGNVTLTKSDVGLGNVDNTADLDKPISTAAQTALSGKVDKEEGKGLSTNDYADADKALLDSVPRDIIVTLAPVQSGEGDPAPDNIRPITGVSSITITRTGKNLIPNNHTGGDPFTHNGVTYTLQSDGSFRLTGTATGQSRYYFTVNNTPVPLASVGLRRGQRLTLSGVPDGYPVWIDFALYNGTIYTGTAYWIYGNSQRVRTFTLPENIDYDRFTFYIRVNAGDKASGAVVSPMLRSADVEDETFEPYHGQSVTVSLPETVYGGTLDVTNGVLTVTQRYMELTGEESWTGFGNYTPYSYYNEFSRNDLPNPLPVQDHQICSHAASLTNLSTSVNSCRVYRAANQTAGRFSIRIAGVGSAAELSDWLKAQATAGTPVQYVYELATPITYQLPATDLTAVASDTVSASAGSVSFSAHTPSPATAAPLMDGTPAAGSSNGYARTDHVHPTDTSRAAQTALDAANNTISAQAAHIAILHELINGIDAPIYRTKTGNPISISDGYPANVKALSVDIQAAQSFNGYSHQWVGGAGKNLIKYPYSMSSGSFYGVTVTVNPDGSLTLNGTSGGDLWGGSCNLMNKIPLDDTPFVAGQTYTIYGGFHTDNIRCGISVECYDENDAVIGYADDKYRHGDVRNFTIDENAVKISVFMRWPSGLVVDNVTIYPMMCAKIADEFPSSAGIAVTQTPDGVSYNGTLIDNTEWSPYANICPISGWNSASITRYGENAQDNPVTVTISFTDSGNNNASITVYGGSLDVTNGVLTVTDHFMSFNGTESWKKVTNWGDSAFNLKITSIGSPYKPKAESGISSHFPYRRSLNSGAGMRVYLNDNSMEVGYVGINTKDANITTVDAFTSWLSEQSSNGTPLQICYPLTTPITYQLTAAQLATLAGNNTISADAGSVTVEYRADPALALGAANNN